ncbi:hypothetical protein ABE10_01685, partial [Bacillus toyonensis]|nr:hypothetical protein [Bacillus toyonensis]
MGLAVEDDAIRKLAHAVVPSFRDRETVVEAQEIEAAVFRAVLDDEDDVVEPVDHVVGKTVELVDDELLEVLGRHLQRGDPDGHMHPGPPAVEAEFRLRGDEAAVECVVGTLLLG